MEEEIEVQRVYFLTKILMAPGSDPGLASLTCDLEPLTLLPHPIVEAHHWKQQNLHRSTKPPEIQKSTLVTPATPALFLQLSNSPKGAFGGFHYRQRDILVRTP